MNISDCWKKKDSQDAKEYSLDESKNERKVKKGELSFKIHPMLASMLAIERDLKCNCCNDSKINNLLKYPLSENDVCYPEFQSNQESH